MQQYIVMGKRKPLKLFTSKKFQLVHSGAGLKAKCSTSAFNYREQIEETA